MKNLREFTLELTLRGPVLTKSTSPSTFGVDAAVARDFRKGRPSVPGTLIKGKVREALEQLGEADRLDEFLGRGAGAGNFTEPERGTLIIGDFVAVNDERRAARCHRIAIEPVLNSAKGQMLRVIETPYAAREHVTFSGVAYCYADDAEARLIADKLRLGLRWLTQVGALRTTGFGRLIDADVSLPPHKAPATANFAAGPLTALDVVLRPQGPLCISRHKIGDNLFESDDIIPGNMLAGAIMETAKALGVVIPDFEKIRFRHAFPTTGTARPSVLPLSTVKAGKIAYDIAKFRDPVLLVDGEGNFSAPTFPVDWKEHGDALATLGWASPARELRVRTKIDSTKRTADRGVGAEGGKLFALEMVHPITDEDENITWRTQIDLNAASSPGATAQALAHALRQLGFVSKTKARCGVDITPVTQAAHAPTVADGDPLALVLQTPTLLADPRFQSLTGVATSGALAAKEMLALYRAAWDELSDGALDLSHHFAQQFLAGGTYLAKWFQKSKAYDPWLLTAAGSVFVFTVKNAAETVKHLERWLATGLPLPKWAVERYSGDWQKNPYRPENGFGEVAVHAPAFAPPVTRAVTLVEAALS